MTRIFDLKNLPERNLYVREMISLHAHIKFDQAVRYVKDNLARMLSAKILEDKTFFWERSSKFAGFDAIEYGADVIVLTREEFYTTQKEAFQKGAEHARGYMTTMGVR